MNLDSLLTSEPLGLHDLLRPLAWAAFGVFMGWWLRKDFTSGKFMQLFESEGSFSLRLLLAGEIVVWLQFMDAAGRLSSTSREAWLFFAGTLLGLGVAKVISKAFAERPPAPPANIDIKAKSATASTESGDIVLDKAPGVATDSNKQPILP